MDCDVLYIHLAWAAELLILVWGAMREPDDLG